VADTPPVLTSLKLSTNIVDLSNGDAPVTFTATGADDVGIDDLELDFGFANGSNIFGGTTSIFGVANWADGTGVATENVTQNTHDGNYSITGAVLFDTGGHQVTYTQAQLQALGVNTTITVTHADTIGPTLTALNLPASVRPGAQLTIGASATDAHGVQRVVVTFDKNIVGGGTAFDLFGNVDSWADGSSASTETVPLGTADGVYTIHDIQLVDNLNNVTTLTTAQLAAAGFSTTITVNGADTTPPTLTALTFPANVDVTAGAHSVTFAASGADNATGIADVKIHFDKDLITGATTGGLVEITGDLDSWADGSSTIVESIPATAQTGDYNVTSVDITDGAGNVHTYTAAQLQAMAGFSTHLHIAAAAQGADHSGPTLTNLVLPSVVNLDSGEGDLIITASASDQTAVADVSIFLDHNISLSTGLTVGFDLNGAFDSWSDGTSSGLWEVLANSPPLYVIDHIVLTDTLGNTTTLTASQLQSLGFNTSFFVNDTASFGVPSANVITGSPGDDILDDTPGNNVIIGGDGNDALVSQGGIDWLIGGFGNDAYYVFNSSDHVFEFTSQGSADIVYAFVSFTLEIDQEIEFLSAGDVTSSVSLTLIGNEFSNTIITDAGDDTVNGGGGFDSAAFSFVRSDYFLATLVVNGTLTTFVINLSETFATDTLVSIENLEFSDHSFLLAGADLNRISNFDGHAYDDVMLQVAGTGQLVFANMEAGHFIGVFGVLTSPLPGVDVVGHADMNGDGIADVIVQVESTDQVLIALQDGSGSGAPTWVAATSALKGGTADFKAVGVGDLDGDALPDILIQNEGVSGDGSILAITGVGSGHPNVISIAGQLRVDNVVDFRVVGVGDINGDGFADVVLQDQLGAGQVLVRDVHDNTFFTLATATGPFQVVGVGDINGDGHADLIMQQAGGGDVIYLDPTGGLNDFKLAVAGIGSFLAAGVADVNNDGFAEILLQNLVTGEVDFRHVGASDAEGFFGAVISPNGGALHLV
jgi:hypothetical protein